MKAMPRQIRSTQEAVNIEWDDGHKSHYVPRELRMACRCAACVDEWTHENRIDVGRIPPTIKPVKMDVIGQHALHIAWSDGHSTGIYTYDYLREVCACETCKAPRTFNV